MQRIIESIESSPVKANEHLVDLTMSIGVNPYPFNPAILEIILSSLKKNSSLAFKPNFEFLAN